VVTRGPRVAPQSGNRVVYRDGVPVAALENSEERIFVPLDASNAIAAREMKILARHLDPRPL
jgi:hypothetical protein